MKPTQSSSLNFNGWKWTLIRINLIKEVERREGGGKRKIKFLLGLIINMWAHSKESDVETMGNLGNIVIHNWLPWNLWWKHGALLNNSAPGIWPTNPRHTLGCVRCETSRSMKTEEGFWSLCLFKFCLSLFFQSQRISRWRYVILVLACLRP
jgi:hypothetical protein